MNGALGKSRCGTVVLQRDWAVSRRDWAVPRRGDPQRLWPWRAGRGKGGADDQWQEESDRRGRHHRAADIGRRDHRRHDGAAERGPADRRGAGGHYRAAAVVARTGLTGRLAAREFAA